MNTNDLKYPIEIWKYTYADNAGGTPIEEFKLYRKVYASLKVRSGNTQENDLGRLPITTVEFGIRYDPFIDYKCQIKYNDVFYQFDHIEIIDRMAWMKIMTTVVNERNYGRETEGNE